MARRKKSPESTSRRSVTQATDSTRSGVQREREGGHERAQSHPHAVSGEPLGSERRRSFEARHRPRRNDRVEQHLVR